MPNTVKLCRYHHQMNVNELARRLANALCFPGIWYGARFPCYLILFSIVHLPLTVYRALPVIGRLARGKRLGNSWTLVTSERRSVMQLTLTGHHVDITESLRAYVQEKFSRLERHFDQVLDVHVILTVEKLRHKAEASLHVSGNKIYADAVEEDMYVALDGLIDKIDRQVVKHKEKLKNHHRNRNEGAHRHHSPEDLELQADEI